MGRGRCEEEYFDAANGNDLELAVYEGGGSGDNKQLERKLDGHLGCSKQNEEQRKLQHRNKPFGPPSLSQPCCPSELKPPSFPGTISLYSYAIHIFVKTHLKSHYRICFHYLPRQRVPGTHHPLCKKPALYISFKPCPSHLKPMPLVIDSSTLGTSF